MAKSSYYASPKPKPLLSRGYFGIVCCTLLAIVVSCTLMALEIYGDYKGQKPNPPAKVKIEPLAPPDKAAPAPAPGPGPVVPPGGG